MDRSQETLKQSAEWVLFNGQLPYQFESAEILNDEPQAVRFTFILRNAPAKTPTATIWCNLRFPRSELEALLDHELRARMTGH